MNNLFYVDIDQGINKGKNKVSRNEKRKKNYLFLKSDISSNAISGQESFESFFKVHEIKAE